VVDFNPAAERLFGVPRAAALGREVGDVIIPERHRAAHRLEIEKLRNGQAVAGFETALEMKGRHADGSEFPIQLLAFHITLGGEQFYTAFITDLSARQEAARQIERQREALRQSEKLSAMGTLLAGVAHELNNPLAIVMGRASLLEEKIGSGPLAADARRIREAAERCGRIVRTFLNMARQKPAARTAVKINDTVRAATDMLGYTLRSHGIVVELDLAENLPDVQADADQIGQVVLNLLVNAQQAMSGQGVAGTPAAADAPGRGIVGGGVRRIQVSSGLQRSGGPRQAPQVWLRVADNGLGISAADRERIFEPFFTTKAAGFGTGLGLSVSRALVREHGGDLVLEDAGAGTRGAVFCLRLPIIGASPPPAPTAARPDEVAEPHSRVLVVDDEPELADLLRAMLEGAGHEVATAESGAVALELLGEARFDAIICDMRMPDLDGAGLWRAVRERDPALARRMLFVTGDTLSRAARQLLDESGCPSLDKPFARADLLASLRAALVR
jgi:two-component system NtrC family sensor kinase